MHGLTAHRASREGKITARVNRLPARKSLPRLVPADPRTEGPAEQPTIAAGPSLAAPGSVVLVVELVQADHESLALVQGDVIVKGVDRG